MSGRVSYLTTFSPGRDKRGEAGAFQNHSAIGCSFSKWDNFDVCRPCVHNVRIGGERRLLAPMMISISKVFTLITIH